MDNLTHSLVGLFLGRLGLRKWTPNGMGVVILAANAPDFDVIPWLWSRADWLRWHRNFTHALLGAPLMAIVSVLIVAAFAALMKRKPMKWWPAFWAALIAVASHIILDLTNDYGVRLLLPFSGHWCHWDTTPVLDFSIWAILLFCVFATMVAGLVSSEIGERRKNRGAGWAFVALFALTAYDYSRFIFHRRAVTIMDSRIWNGLAARRAGAFPSANPLVWTGIVELSNAYIEVPVDLRDGFHPLDGVTYDKATRGPATLAAMATPAFDVMQQFVQYPLWIVEPGPESTFVALIDLRFGTPESPGFNATARVGLNGQVLDSRFGFGGARPR